MNIEELKEQLILKDKEISLLLNYCKDLKNLQNSDHNFNEMIILLNELSSILKENAIYQQYINDSVGHLYESEEVNMINNDYISELKLLIKWFSDKNIEYEYELTNKNNEYNDMVINIEELLNDKNKEIDELNDIIHGKDINYSNLCTLVKKNKDETNTIMENYEEEISQLHESIQNNYTMIYELNEIIKNKENELNLLNDQLNNTQCNIINYNKLFKNNNKYIVELENVKNELTNLNINKDLEIYKLHNEILNNEQLIADLQNEEDEEFTNPLYINETEEEIKLLKLKIDKYENELKNKDYKIVMQQVENNNLSMQNNQKQQTIDELNIVNSHYFEMIQNIKNFITETQQSNYFIFNPTKIVESIILLFNDNICYDFSYKNINMVNRC
jgi:hypothetical protein